MSRSSSSSSAPSATSSASSAAPSSSPGSWTGASSRSAGMARVSDEPRAPNDYRWARQVSALLLIAVVVVIVVLDVIVEEYEVRAPVLVPAAPHRRGSALGRPAHGSRPLMAAYGTDPARYLPPHTSQLATKLSADGVDDCLVCSHPRPRQRRQPRRGDPDTAGHEPTTAAARPDRRPDAQQARRPGHGRPRSSSTVPCPPRPPAGWWP